MEWFTTNWALIADAFTNGHYFTGLTNPLGLLITGTLVFFGFVLPRFRKTIFLIVGGGWAYLTVHHFTLEKTVVDLQSFDAVHGTSSIGNMALFFLSCAIITGVLLYFILVRD
jgi:hypothetical protein